MDDETARLVLQLQLEELQEATSKLKGKQPAGEASDFEVSLKCYKDNLDESMTLVSDRILCKSIASAVQTDGEVISEVKVQEQQATADRALALRARNGEVPVPTNTGRQLRETNDEGDDIDDELLERMAAMNAFGPADDILKEATGTNDVRCVSCLEYVASCDVAKAPCNHNYCRQCLQELFKLSLTDESLFPPRCCGQPITAEANRMFLSPQVLGEYHAKKLERDTPNRTYCHQPQCSAFIPPHFIRHEVARCVRCKEKTCVTCKGASHEGDCPEDPRVKELLEVAARNGWQQCYSCQRLVELHHGCYHMTCLCRAEFCYVCGARWKTCKCPQWDEDRLIERAHVVVNRELGNRRVPAAQVAEMVQQARQRLVDDHECQHRNWRSIDGPRACEQCRDIMPIWLNVCQRCNLMVCRRCRHNRL